MLSGTKIAGQLRKNSSGHATWIFAKKSRKFEIPAVRLKGFLQSCTCVSFTRIKNINITWHLVPLSVYPIRKPSVADILHSLFTYTPVRDDPNDLTGSQTYLLLKSKIMTGSEQTWSYVITISFYKHRKIPLYKYLQQQKPVDNVDKHSKIWERILAL